MKYFLSLLLIVIFFSCTKTPPFPEEFSIRLENNPTVCGFVHISLNEPDSYNYRYMVHTKYINSYIDDCDNEIGMTEEYDFFEDATPATWQTDLPFEVSCPGIYEVYVIRHLLSPSTGSVVAPSKGKNHLFVQVDPCN